MRHGAAAWDRVKAQSGCSGLPVKRRVRVLVGIPTADLSSAATNFASCSHLHIAARPAKFRPRMRLPIIFFTLITSTFAAQEAQVYFLPPNPTQHHQAPALNPTEANALISHHLGLDVYENLPDQVEGWWHKVTGWVYGNVVTSGVGQGQQDSVLIVIQSDHPEGSALLFLCAG